MTNVPSPYLLVVTEHHDRGPVLRLRGELDVSSKDLLERAISAALEPPPQMLVFNLSELAFMDCGGASVLRRTHDLLAGRQTQILVTGAQPIVRRLFHLLGLDTCLDLNAPAA